VRGALGDVGAAFVEAHFGSMDAGEEARQRDGSNGRSVEA